jgi:succinate dehydrogenase / fumarate reductase, membrane anchor subunit
MSGHRGSGHFFRQRFTAVLLIPLTVWFVYSVARYTGADHATVSAFLADPFNAGMMLALILIGVYHMVLGMQVVIEDYIEEGGTRSLLMGLNTIFGLLAASACGLAVAKLANWIQI